MPTATLEKVKGKSKVKKLKSTFQKELKEDLTAIIRLMLTGTDVDEAYLNRAKNAAEGLAIIAASESNTLQKTVYEKLLRALRAGDLEKLAECRKEIKDFK